MFAPPTQSAVAVGKVRAAEFEMEPFAAAANELAGAETRAYEPPVGSVTPVPFSAGAVDERAT